LAITPHFGGGAGAAAGRVLFPNTPAPTAQTAGAAVTWANIVRGVDENNNPIGGFGGMGGTVNPIGGLGGGNNLNGGLGNLQIPTGGWGGGHSVADGLFRETFTSN
jgi:hypothetical protein